KAEDGIRDRNVTGVQTCALPISPRDPDPLHQPDWTAAELQCPLRGRAQLGEAALQRDRLPGHQRGAGAVHVLDAVRRLPRPAAEDRKSTRLNSSHVSISYAVFCL